LDFGYVHAQAIERAGFKEDHNNVKEIALYVFDELHEKNRTNAQFIEDAESYFGDKLYEMFMTADSANPDKIKEWNEKGYKVDPAKKGDGSLRFGIEYLAGIKMYIDGNKCPELASEIASFKRKEDRDGIVTEDFVEINDDGIAALRYGSEYIWSNVNGVFYNGTDSGDWSLSDIGL
jgi:phage terminase large subunit